MLKDEFKKKNNERKKTRVNSSNMRDTAKSTPPLIFFKIKIKKKKTTVTYCLLALNPNLYHKVSELNKRKGERRGAEFHHLHAWTCFLTCEIMIIKKNTINDNTYPLYRQYQKQQLCT